MAEDFDVEAMLEAPYRKDEELNGKSKENGESRRDRYSDSGRKRSSRSRSKDRKRTKHDSDRKRSRSKDRKRSRDRRRSKSRDRKSKSRDRKSRSRDRISRSRDRKSKSRDRKSRSRDRRSRSKEITSKSRDRRSKSRDKRSKSRERFSRRRSRSKDRKSSPIRDRRVKRSYSKERKRRSRSRKRSPSLHKGPPFGRKRSPLRARSGSPLEELSPEERDARTVFAMQLSQRIRARDLEEFFSSVGKVRDVRLIMCNKTRRFKGIAYIEFKDPESVALALGLSGQKLLGIPIIVQHTQEKFNTFSWSKIMKISFKRKQFFIQLRREPSEDYDTILVFNMESYKSAKKLWKSCVEHHTFFRLHSPKVKRKFPFSLGSKFSYSGRTEFQTVTEVQQKGKIEHKFVRSPSRQIIKQIISTATPSLEEKGKTPTAPNRPPRPYDNKVTSLGSKGPRKAWGAESQISSDDGDILEKPLDVPFSPGKILSYADEDMPSPTSNGLYDTPPYSASHSPVSQIIEEGSVTITLYPDEEGKYGFNVKGGMAKGIPIVVMKVAPNTPADTCTPRLSEGDQILQINGKEMSSSTYEEAVRLIQEARTTDDGKLVLQVKPNVVYSGLDEYEEPPYQYVPIGDVEAVQSGNPLEQSMLLLADGLASGAVVVRFEALYRKHPDMTCDESAKPKNVNKNRYRDISPYDETRVILKNGNNGDYINANYVNMSINSTDIVNRYIATQGPLQSTTEDFWQMILEERCTLIIMLTTLVERGRTKCHKYWPSVGENLTVQDTRIKCIKEETDLTGSVVFRDFVLTNSETEELREIKHIQYVVWPDHGVPSSPAQFLSFTEQVREARKGEAPVIVHCSAGIGRTGVLILMETAMCLIENEEPVYPLEIVKTMREQRAMMIQNASQYRFVCECVYAAFMRRVMQQKKEELEETR